MSTEVVLEGTFPVVEEEETGYTVEVWAGTGDATSLQDLPISATQATEGQALVMTGGTWVPTGIATQAELDAVGSIAVAAGAAADAAQDTADLAAAAIAAHAALQNNPHAVTAAQVGAYTTAAADAATAAALAAFTGTSNIVTLGTITTGTVPAARVSAGIFQSGTFTMTGLVAGLDAGAGTVIVNGAAGQTRDVRFTTASLNRWILRANAVAESGAEAGSNLELLARLDNGGALDTPVSIVRAAGGAITVSRPLSAGSTLNVTGVVTLSDTLTFAANGVAAAGSIYKRAVDGLVVRGATGSSTDMVLLNPAGTVIMSVATGTNTAAFQSTVTVGGVLQASGGIQRGSATSLLNITGGSSTSLGARLVLYGETHATQPNQLEFRASSAIRGTMDLANSWFNWGGQLFVNDTSNANMTTGLTLNQGAADNQILALKSSDVAHGLTTAGIANAETDDWLVFQKANGPIGGAVIQALAENGALTQALRLVSIGGQADTTHTAAGVGLVDIFVSQHDGANVLANVAAGGNALAVRVRSATNNLARLLLTVEGDLYLPGATATDKLGNGLWLLNDTSNANMALGLTINMGTQDNQVLCFKSSDVTTGLTSAVVPSAFDVETDDFGVFAKASSNSGGLQVMGLAESGGAFGLVFDSYSGAPATTDTSASLGAMCFYVAQHSGANVLQDMAADSNGFTWGEIDAGGNRLTRMLLKADDGELHLGNTTLVALDWEDDLGAVRGLQRVRTGGRGIRETRYERPAYSFEALRALGVVGERDARGDFLIRVQPYLNLHDGALWQLHTRAAALEEALRDVLTLNPGLAGADRALALLEA